MQAALYNDTCSFSWFMESPTANSGTDTEDGQLARAAARGDDDAFARLVRRHERAIFGLCYRLLGNSDDARDAAQEAFVRAYGSLERYDGAQPFAPWALRIARNHCIDLLRRRAPTVSLDAPIGDSDDTAHDVPDGTPRADEQLDSARTTRALEIAIAALPENYRSAVTLFHVQGLAYKDIAQVMNVPIGTVMTWLHRARAQLREQLGEDA